MMFTISHRILSVENCFKRESPMIRKCKYCEINFNSKHEQHRGGYIDVCGDCEMEKEDRVIGFTASTGKSDYFTEIIAVHDEDLRRFVLRQGRSGPSQCSTSLALTNNGSAVNATKSRTK